MWHYIACSASYFEKVLSETGFPSHRSLLTPAIQHRAASTAVFRHPSSPSSCFRRRFSTQFCGATHLGCPCDSPSPLNPGRMPLEAGVSSKGMCLYPAAWRKCRSTGDGAQPIDFPRYIPACWLRRCWDYGDQIAVTVGRNFWFRYINALSRTFILRFGRGVS